MIIDLLAIVFMNKRKRVGSAAGRTVRSKASVKFD